MVSQHCEGQMCILQLTVDPEYSWCWCTKIFLYHKSAFGSSLLWVTDCDLLTAHTHNAVACRSTIAVETEEYRQHIESRGTSSSAELW